MTMVSKSFSAFLLLVFVAPLFVFGSSTSQQEATTPPFSLGELEQRVASFTPDPDNRHDQAAWVAVQEALAAAKEGNYGIGACLFNETSGELVQRGQNRIFSPYFRSDLHAEMDTLTGYEERIKSKDPVVDGLILYTSVEPCPMCLARIITSGLHKVYYVAPDPNGGMVHLIDNLPPVWLEIAKGRTYEQAPCSPELKELADNIFAYSAHMLDVELERK